MLFICIRIGKLHLHGARVASRCVSPTFTQFPGEEGDPEKLAIEGNITQLGNIYPVMPA